MSNKIKTRWLGLTILIDIGLTIAALFLARWLRGQFPAGYYFDRPFSLVLLNEPLYFSYIALIPVVVATWLAVFTALSIYDTQQIFDQYNRIQPILVAVTGAIFVLAGLAYFLFRDLSRLLFFYFYILDLIFLISWRKLVFYFLNENLLQKWRPHHRILIVGEGQLAQDVKSAIETFAWSGLELAGFIKINGNSEESATDIKQHVNDLQIDEVIFALPPGYQSLLQKLVYQLQPLSVNMRLVPDVLNLVFVRATIEDFAGLPLIGLRQPAISVFDRLVKRLFDIAVAGLLATITLPISLLAALFIKLSGKGPVFYASQRVGEGGKIFKMYKFRTMVLDADQIETDLFVQQNGTIGLNKRPDDPRITTIGRLLRRTSLDELPQLFNILKGDMSLVGPRPELPWLVDRYEPWQYQRFAVPQGLTGWWQVKNRDKQQAYDVRVEDDLYYIHNYSLLLDMRIIWLTVEAILRGNGAF